MILLVIMFMMMPDNVVMVQGSGLRVYDVMMMIGNDDRGDHDDHHDYDDHDHGDHADHDDGSDNETC